MTIDPLHRISNSRAGWSVLQQWILIAAAVWWALHTPWGIIPAVLIISSRQQALAVLMHDASHRILFRPRWLNDGLGNILCAYPVGISVGNYRRDHLLHHAHLMTPADPYAQQWDAASDWHWPKSPGAARRRWLFDLLGLHGWRTWAYLWQLSPFSSARSLLGFLVWGTAVGMALTWTHGWLWFLGLWLVPLNTLTFATFRLRTSVEHLHLPASLDPAQRTRHVEAPWWERAWIAPLSVHYHRVHHHDARLPHYRLRIAHQALREDGEVFDSYLTTGKRAYDALLQL